MKKKEQKGPKGDHRISVPNYLPDVINVCFANHRRTMQ